VVNDVIMSMFALLNWGCRLNDGLRSQHLPGSQMDSGLVGEKTLDAS
jgi:hypothetical protein